MTDELRVRVVVEQALATGQQLAREAGRRPVGAPSSGVSDANRGTHDEERENFRKDAARAREEVKTWWSTVDENGKVKKGWIQKTGERHLSGTGGAAALAVGGASLAGWGAKKLGATDETVNNIAQVGIAGAILAGGAKIIEEYIPMIVAAVGEAMGLPKASVDGMSDLISNKISEALNAAMASITATGDTLELERAKVRLGGTSGIEQAKNTWAGFYEVNRQRGEIEARFNRDIARDLGRQIAQIAMGGHG